MGRVLPVLIATVLLFSPLAAMEVPYLGGRVNDLAAMIPDGDETRIEATLAELERDTGAQVVVLTVPSLEGEVLEDFALRVAETWQLGRADHDDGVLVLVTQNERRIRIEVGYGLEGAVPDALAKRIIDSVMTPRFREGNFAAGIEEAVGALAGLIRGESVDLPEQGPAELSGFETVIAMIIGGGIFFIVIGTFSVVALFSKGGQAWFVYVFLLPFYLLFPVGIFGLWGLVLPVLWVVGFPILRRLTWHTDRGRQFRSAHPGWVTFAASSGRSSGGGFSGGGGSFGGGGASGGW